MSSTKLQSLIFLAAACCLPLSARAQTCGYSGISAPTNQTINANSDSFQDTLAFQVMATTTNSFNALIRKGGAGFGDFGLWTLTKSGSGSGGWFTGNSNGNGGGDTNEDIGYSWGLWANSGQLVNAIRLFSPTTNSEALPYISYYPNWGLPMALPVGVTLGVDMDNGYVSSGSSVGVSIQNTEGQSLWEWYFPGGASTYSYHDNSGYNSSTLGWSQTGMHIAFTLTSSNTYSATVTLTSGGSFTASGSLISEPDLAPVQVRAFNNSAGSGSAYDFFVNNISILDKSDNANTSTYLSPRSWTNGVGSGWDLATTGTNAGFFLASGTPIDGVGPFSGMQPTLALPNNSWALWANSGDIADAIRPFGQPVYVSNVVAVTMANGFVSTGASVGFGLQSGATNRFEFFFGGGNSDYSINDAGGTRDTGLPWTTNGMVITFMLTSTNTYSLTVQTLSGPSTNITGTLEGHTDSLIDRIRLFNAFAGSGSSHNLYFSMLTVGESPANTGAYDCDPDYDCAAAMKFDQSNLYYLQWNSGMDHGFGLLSQHPLPDDLGDPGAMGYSSPNPISIHGNKDLQGCYDALLTQATPDGSFCWTNATPWAVISSP